MAVDNCSGGNFSGFTPLVDVPCSIADIVILTISYFLNITILMSVCCNNRLHTFSNVFIASLAVSDLIFATALSDNVFNTTLRGNDLPTAASLPGFTMCVFILNFF